MIVLAEIVDKLPSAPRIVLVCGAVAVLCVAVASAHRVAAWGVLLLGVVAGTFFAMGGYRQAFVVEGPLSDDVWRELGGLWVAASIVGPLLPAIAVAVLMILRRRRLAR